MLISSTKIQNNFGHYLMQAANEDITITKNGKEVAQLTSLINAKSKQENIVSETNTNYIYNGKKTNFEEYLELASEKDERYEYIDGKIYNTTAPKTTHQLAQSKLLERFFNYFADSKYTVMVAPYDITLKRNQDDINIVQPDIMIISDLEKNLNEKDYYIGVPTLVAEILSESTLSKDMIKKLDLYMEAGVEEYWIINTLNQEIMIYQSNNNELIDSKTFKKSEEITSFNFKGLQFSLKNIFK